MLTISFPLLVALNEKGVSKSFPSVYPSSLPTHHAHTVRVLVFTSCFFSLYHPTHPPPRSLPTSPAENDSQSIFTLWSSPLSVRSTHFPLFPTTPTLLVSILFFFFSLCLFFTVLLERFTWTFELCLAEAHLHNEPVKRCLGI